MTHGGQRPQRIPLRRFTTLQFVDFVGNPVVEKSIHIAANELYRRHPMNLVIVGLP
jgi:hypothetical protein